MSCIHVGNRPNQALESREDRFAQMTDRPSAVVLVPAHRVPTTVEGFSYRRCVESLGGRWPIVVVCPESLDVSWVDAETRVERLPDSWFESNAAYSALLLTRAFYERFSTFDFMLIHQLDCFVFEDQLAEWCARGWDYVGPPFFREYTADSGALEGVGCGGFSLRRIEASLDVLGSWRGRSSDRDALRRVAAFVARRALRDTPAEWRVRRAVRAQRAEDRFWASVPSWLPGFTIPDVDEAALFGFELGGLPLMASYYGDRVPFGCHATSDVAAARELILDGRSPVTANERHLADLLERAGLLGS